MNTSPRQTKTESFSPADIRQVTIHGKERRSLLESVRCDLQRRSGKKTARQSSRLHLVTGPSGCGKSTLCHSLKEPIETEHGGWFLSGKIDQFEPQRSNPFVSAVSGAVDRIDEGSKAEIELEFWFDLPALVRAVPAMNGLFESDEVNGVSCGEDERETGDARTRFHRIFCRLLSLLCRSRPVVLFVDDLQWGGATGTYDLLTEILCDDLIEGLVVIAACRRVSEEHELSCCLRSLDSTGVEIEEVNLKNMSCDELCEHLATLLDKSWTESQPLSEVLYAYTGGNHFSTHQVISFLLDEGILFEQDDEWRWDEDGLRSRLSQEDSLHLITRRLEALPSDVQIVLKVAACLGASFDQTFLRCSLPSGLYSRMDELVSYASRKRLIKTGRTQWCFAHDQIQQAAYSMMKKGEKERLHLEIGRRQLRHLSKEDLESNVLQIAGQLRHGAHLVEEKERSHLSEFFLRAGKTAAQLSHFGAASAFFETAISLLPQDHWRLRYDISLELYNGSAEVAYIQAEFAKLENLVTEVLAHAKCFLDQLRAYTTKIYALGAANEQQKAIEVARTVLNELEEPLPTKMTKTAVTLEYLKVRLRFHKMTEQEFLRLPSMTDPMKLAAVRIMALILHYAFETGGYVAAFFAIRIIRVSFKYGISHMTAAGLALYGSLVCALGSVEHGTMLGELALKVSERFRQREWRCRVIFTVAFNIKSYTQTPRELREPFQEAAQLGLNSGDIEGALLSVGLDISQCAEYGQSLSTALSRWRSVRKVMERYGQMSTLKVFSPGVQVVANLLGEGEGHQAWVLKGEFIDEDDCELDLENNLRLFGLLCIGKLYVAFIMGEFDAVAQILSIIRARVKAEELMHPAALLAIELKTGLASLTSGRRPNYRRARVALRRIKKLAFHSPNYHMGRVFLLEAEIAARKGRVNEAIMMYESSTAFFMKERVLYMQAWSCERQGMLFEKVGRARDAVVYLKQARDLFEEWRCIVKVDQLDALLSKQNRI